MATTRLNFRVRGVTFRRREALGVSHMLREHRLEVRLIPEPDNPHDPHAVRVEVRPRERANDPFWFVGYVPRTLAPQVAAVIVAGKLRRVALTRGGTVKDDGETPWLTVRAEW